MRVREFYEGEMKMTARQCRYTGMPPSVFHDFVKVTLLGNEFAGINLQQQHEQ
jgi:hypothetical protein